MAVPKSTNGTWQNSWLFLKLLADDTGMHLLSRSNFFVPNTSSTRMVWFRVQLHFTPCFFECPPCLTKLWMQPTWGPVSHCQPNLAIVIQESTLCRFSVVFRLAWPPWPRFAILFTQVVNDYMRLAWCTGECNDVQRWDWPTNLAARVNTCGGWRLLALASSACSLSRVKHHLYNALVTKARYKYYHDSWRMGAWTALLQLPPKGLQGENRFMEPGTFLRCLYTPLFDSIWFPDFWAWVWNQRHKGNAWGILGLRLVKEKD